MSNSVNGKKKKSKLKSLLLIGVVIVVVLIIIIALADDDIDSDYADYGQPVNNPSVSAGTTPAAPAASATPAETPQSVAYTPVASGQNIYDSRVYAIEVNQSLSWGYDTENGGYFLMDHFAAGKETAIFVTFTEPLRNVLGRSTSADIVVSKGGDFLTALDWIDYADDYTLYFQPKNMADVANWSAGSYTFEFYIGGEVAAERTVGFHDTIDMKILAVPIVANYGGWIARCNGDWRNGDEMVYATFPVAKSRVQYILGAELDLSGSRYNLETESGMRNVWEALANLQTPGNDYTVIIGFVPDPMDGTLGYTYGLPAVVASESDPEMLATVIHEIAHVYGIGDEYEGGSINLRVNTPPYGMSGRDMFGMRTVTAQNRLISDGSAVGSDGTGAAIYPAQRPFYVEGRRLLGPVSSYMGGGTGGRSFDMWVTSELWIHKFNVFTGQIPIPDYDDSDFSFFDLLGALFGKNDAARVSEYVMAVEITGFLESGGGFEPSPWYTYETDTIYLNSRSSGEYGVFFYDEGGREISSSYFDVDFYNQVHTQQGVRFVQMSHAPVSVIVEFPEQAARIVMRRGETEIYSTSVSRTAPQVEFTGLTDYQQLTDAVTLTWEASGETDELYFEIWYCPSEGDFYNIVTNVTGRSFTFDLSGYPGTDEGYFYIFATDGVRTGGIDSPWVRAPFKAPQFISVQDSIPQFKITEEIFFDADIYDLQDGWLWDVDQVVWTLGGREFISGSCLWVWPYELAPGTHTFQCTATNSVGMTAQVEFTFRIVDDESDLPADWSREDVKTALSDGFAVDLRRIDVAINRGEFAVLMATMFGTVSEEYDPYPDYIEGLVIDCGYDDYDQFLMVWLGVMDAPGGLFNPRGSLTEREAALIMYRVAELADPDWFGSGASDAEILEFLYDVMAIEQSGPNALDDARPLTNKLALVRLSRLYAAIYEV